MRIRNRTFAYFLPFLILVMAGIARAQTIAGPSKAQDAVNAIKGHSVLTVSFQTGVTTSDTVIVIVAFHKAINVDNISVMGLGANGGLAGSDPCTAGYAPPFTNKIGIAFFYCANVQSSAKDKKTITITVKSKDNLVASAQEWRGLTAIEDGAARASSSGNSSTLVATASTNQADEVIFTAMAYNSRALLSPPQPSPQPALGYSDSFRAMVANVNLYPPSLIGSYYITGTAGQYVNSATLNKSRKWFSATIALEATSPPNPLPVFTPLDDFGPNDTYTPSLPTQGSVAFPGNLYEGTNDLATASPQHDADGRTLAGLIQPLDAKGEPSKNGKIGVLAIGMSNWTEDNCTGNPGQLPKCDPGTFFDQLKRQASLNKKVVLADCAQGAAFPQDWMPAQSSGGATSAWPNCIGPKSKTNADLLHTVYKLNPNQVQVVLWEDADDSAFQSLPPLLGMSSMTSTSCPLNPSGVVTTYNQTAADACVYEWEVAQVATEVKILFPNVQMMFLHSRIYGGYTDSRSPHYEPYTYEYGFATKWLIQAQIAQMAGGSPDPLDGDLCYQAPCPTNSAAAAVPWLAWGPYFWANPPTAPAGSNGIQWLGGDLTFDGIHGSWCRFDGIECGRQKVGTAMFDFYTKSPYTAPWLCNAGNCALTGPKKTTNMTD